MGRSPEIKYSEVGGSVAVVCGMVVVGSGAVVSGRMDAGSGTVVVSSVVVVVTAAVLFFCHYGSEHRQRSLSG